MAGLQRIGVMCFEDEHLVPFMSGKYDQRWRGL